jgi:hypothetical protein
MEEKPKTKPSFWQRSSIGRFCRGVRSPRTVRRFIIVAVWIVVIVALFYGGENWRGHHAWMQYRKAAETRGESLDFTTYIPKPVPDDQNFAATPFLQNFLTKPYTQILTNDLYAQAGDYKFEDNDSSQNSTRHFRDLVAWKMAFDALQRGPLPRGQVYKTDKTNLTERTAAAPSVLQGMEMDEPVFAELRAASTREFSRFPLKYDVSDPGTILLPHLARILEICRRLSLVSCAQLTLGHSDEAEANVKLDLALADSIKSESILISLIVRGRSVEQGIQPVWEGLAEHRWTERQLQELQKQFESYDFLTDLRRAINAERAMDAAEIDAAHQWPSQMLPSVARLFPSGWWDMEKLNFETTFDDETQGVINLAARTISPAAADAGAHKVIPGSRDYAYGLVNQNSPNPINAFSAALHHRLIASLLLPSLRNVYAKIAGSQVAVDQAALACALERYRLVHGQYPETLAALAPTLIAHIPNDVVTGQPYKYEQTTDGKFKLSSAGWSGADAVDAQGKFVYGLLRETWVWSYPAF